MNFAGKKILFFSPKYFNYELEIKNQIERFGAVVDYFDERPRNDFLTKVLIRLNFKVLIKRRIDKYYATILNETKNHDYDYILLVNPEVITIKHLSLFRSVHINAIIIVYMWDSVRNKKNSFDLLPIADKFMTFDPEDSYLDEKIEFLPLFYINSYGKLASISPAKYDLLFIGTIHSDRYKILKKITMMVKHSDLQAFIYLFSPSPYLFILTKLFRMREMNVKYSDVSFKSLSKNEILSYIATSKVIIDIEHPLQNGLTMRCIEMVGAKKKLITTNNKIKKYDFFNKNNILIIDRNNIHFNMEFFDTPYQPIDDAIYTKYSLSAWIRSVFTIPE